MYKWFLALRYLHTKLIAFFGIAAVTLCVAMVLVVMSVMGGFLDTIRNRARGMLADVVVESRSLQGFPLYDEFAVYLRKELPDVVRTTTPVLHTYGVLRIPANTYTKPARILGIRLDEYVQVNDFARGLHYNRYFPGTTHLTPQEMPVAGLTENAGLRLPRELERALAEWRKHETDAAVRQRFERSPFERAPFPYVTADFPGERVFAASVDPPHYEGPPYPGCIVGADLLFNRRPDGNFERYLARGAPLSLMFGALSLSGNPMGEPPVRMPARYADDSRTGIYEVDSLFVYVDFDQLQEKLAMTSQPLADGGQTRPRTNQILCALHSGVELNQARAHIERAWEAFRRANENQVADAEARLLAFVDVYTWEDLQRPFIAAVEKEKVLVTILFALISGVAIVLIGCIFYMIVEKKTRDIGLLKSVGASSAGIAGMFILYAAAVGVTGSVLGTVLGTVFVWNINDIQDVLANLNPALRVWNPEVYSFDRIPETVKRADAIWIALVAVLSSMAGSLIPATIAGRVWPVRTLRYE